MSRHHCLPLRWIIQSSLIARSCRLFSNAKGCSPLSPLRLHRWISSFHHPSHRSSPLPLLLHRWQSNSTNKCNTDNVIEYNTNDDQRREEEGETLYNLAAEALHNANKARHIRQEKLLQEQYDAADKGRAKKQRRKEERQGNNRSLLLPPEDNNNSTIKDRAAGMAVVRKIVEQTRASKNDAVRVEKWNTVNNNDDEIIIHNEQQQQVNDNEEYWHNKARLYMEESALRYGYGPALVRLGNDALERARKEGEDDHSSASTSSSSFVDRNRCMGWKYESPVRRLELILKITNKSESISYLELAKHLYEEAGEHGSSEGLYNLGHILWDEDEFVSAMDAFHAAMTMGDADAMYFVAAQYLSYEEDDGVTSFLPKVYERYGPVYVSSTLQLDTTTMTPPLSLVNDLQRHGYVLLYHAVNKHGHGPATHHLALLCNQNGNIKEFCRLLSLAANGGNPDSLFLRGHCYYFGTDGHIRDMSLAFTDFIAAADGGSIDAMVSAGAMLHQGVRSDDGMTIIVDRDQQRAFELYQRAGELGSIEGWRNVVSCYATGEGVKKCIDTAKYIANTMLKDDR